MTNLMNTYSMTCSCGDVMTVDAENRDQAVSDLKAKMTADEIAKHMAAKHPDQPVPPVDMIHASIEKDLKPSV